MRTCLRPSFHRVFRDSFPNGYAISGLKSGISDRLQTRVARATGPYRPATRRTERVRRSVCLRRPFPTVRPAPLSRAGSPAGRARGPCHPCRARHSVYAAPATSACKISPASPSQPVANHRNSQMLRPNFGIRAKSALAFPGFPRKKPLFFVKASALNVQHLHNPLPI